ncbi:hypothetical protein [Micromonospora arida]|uniref:hypothetical protein n=1 Tax=Micromonospora arida TaxID=2203715 RepID=UPI003CF2A0B6
MDLPPLTSSSVDREQLRAFVRYSLSQLRNRNEHHRFEHLCVALARQRITPNIVVGSGPVSSGGDQGRDFETFRAYTQEHVRDVGVKLDIKDEQTIVFCCTVGQDDISKKVRRDLKSLTSSGTKADVVVYFSEQDIPTATRHKLAEEALAREKLRLELLDGQTITGLLCDRDTFWIAVEFLDVPVHFAPQDAGPEWYSASRTRWLENERRASTSGDLMELAACIRFATLNEGLRGDIAMWLGKMSPILEEGVDPDLRRRARYETAVANYRGLGNLRTADALVRLVLEAARLSESVEEIDSASVLYQYAQSAWMFQATGLQADELDRCGEELENQALHLAACAEIPDQRCRLLWIVGRIRTRTNLCALAASGLRRPQSDMPPPLSQQQWKEACSLYSPQVELRVSDPQGTVAAWYEAVRLLDSAPLFPVQWFAENVALYSAALHDEPNWSSLVSQLDQFVAVSAGRQAAARVARSRSLSLIAAGKPFAALHELHSAREALVAGDTHYEGADALLDAAEVYLELGLLYAAKHYALAAGAVISMGKETHHPLVVSSLILSARCDFLAGNWFSLMAMLPQVLDAHTNLRHAPDDPRNWDDFLALVGCLRMVKDFVDRSADASLKRWMNSKLKTIGLNRDDEELPIPDVSREDIAVSLPSELGQPGFADTGNNREIRFEARGLRWRVRSRNTYDDVRAAERFAAATQIVIAALGDEDLVLIEATVEVRIKTILPRQGGEVAKRPPKSTGRASDGAHRYEVVLTRDTGPHSLAYLPAAGEVAGAATSVFLSMSLLPPGPIESILNKVGDKGALLLAVFPHIRYDRAYAVLPKEDFAEAERRALGPAGPPSFGETLMSEHLGRLDGPGPVFRGETPAERAHGRYPIYEQILRITLPRLAQERRIRSVISELRNEGWKDWHILMAISNLVLNSRLRSSREDFDDPAVRARISRFEPEQPSDEQIDLASVTVDSLRSHLMVSVGATADAYGLTPAPTMSPEEILGVLASRYSYWTDDAPHEDPFQIR